MNQVSGPVVVLSGGVGGAKLVLGLSRILTDGLLTVIANTGDDFEHLGLAVSPDLDTLMYTLAGEVNPETGWGRRDETWSFMESLEQLGGETWFRLGDRDLATHIERTRRLTQGDRLTDITRDFCDRFNVATQILPMSDDAVRTRVVTDRGQLDFQQYFVRDRTEPKVIGLEYVGANDAAASREVLDALRKPDLAAIIIAPSNPYLSVDPILAVPGLDEAIRAADAPVIAVSPIVHGMAIKGPTAKIMEELGLAPSADNIARHYGDLIDGFLLDTTDANIVAEIETPDLKVTSCNTIMSSLEDKIRVGNACLDFAELLGGRA